MSLVTAYKQNIIIVLKYVLAVYFQKTFNGSRMMFSFGRREPFHKLIVEGNAGGRYYTKDIFYYNGGTW